MVNTMADIDYKKLIAQNIRKHREILGWNQTTLGILALGYPDTAKGRQAAQSKIKNIELGKVDVRINQLVDIIHTLNISLVDLLVDEGRGVAPSMQDVNTGNCTLECPYKTCSEIAFTLCRDALEVIDSHHSEAANALASNIQMIKAYIRRSESFVALQQDVERLGRSLEDITRKTAEEALPPFPHLIELKR